MAGIATIVQSLGIGPVGIRMPVMMGASFAAVGSMVAMAGMPGIGLQGIFGATIAAGFFGMIIAPFMSKVVRFFPPLVTGTVITSIGLSLFPVAVNWAGGGAAASQFGSPIYLTIAALVLGTILLVHRFMRGFWVNISVLIGMCLGYILCGLLGMVDLSGMTQAPWLQFVTPAAFRHAEIRTRADPVDVSGGGDHLRRVHRDVPGPGQDHRPGSLPTHAASRLAVRCRCFVCRRFLQHLHPHPPSPRTSAWCR